MARVAGSRTLFCTDNNLLISKGKREHVSCHAINPPTKISMRKGETGKLCMVTNLPSSTGKHLNSLNSYLGKLHNDEKKPFSKILNPRTETISKNDQPKVDDGLRSLENYLDKVKGGVKYYQKEAESENYVEKDLQASTNTSPKKEQEGERERLLKNYVELRPEDAEGRQSEDEVSDFYLIGILASINIAVFLFEIATPVKNSSFELFSLPLIYGAKINTLILTGEWWRLVTPMFLHSGVFHIALGSWVLFNFGLQVSRQYGSFTFLLIYILGGISGNLISFLHTPEPTVGGTGPVFAIIGAWLIYQVQNKDVIARDSSDKMFQNAIITTALSFVLSSFGPIDDWAHFASAFTGIAYGFVTCPTLQVKDASSPEAGRQERMMLVRRYADPCKSLMYFSIFLLLLSSLLFIIEPPIDLI